MSVDCTAKIVYGWLIDNDESYDYNERMRARNMDTSDYFQCINAYSHDTDYVYGIEIMRSNYIQFIEYDMISPNAWEDDDDWVECQLQFKEDFPDKYNNLKPGFFLVCNWW